MDILIHITIFIIIILCYSFQLKLVHVFNDRAHEILLKNTHNESHMCSRMSEFSERSQHWEKSTVWRAEILQDLLLKF